MVQNYGRPLGRDQGNALEEACSRTGGVDKEDQIGPISKWRRRAIPGAAGPPHLLPTVLGHLDDPPTMLLYRIEPSVPPFFRASLAAPQGSLPLGLALAVLLGAAVPQARAEEIPSRQGADRHAAPAAPAPFEIGGHSFHRRALGNGLKALAVRDASEPTVSVFLAVDAGRRHETEETNGLAHLTEHALYTGTKRTPAGAHDARIHELGGESNASTRDDYVLIYNHELPTAALAEVLAMEADRLRGLDWDRDAVLHERDRLRLEEARTYTRAMAREERLEAVAFPDHAYGVGVLEEEDGALHTRGPELGLEQIRAFYDAHYHPSRTAVVVVGDVDPKLALDAVEAAFGKLPPGPPAPERSSGGASPAASADRPGEHVFASSLGAARLGWIWTGPPLDHPDRPVLGLLARWLGRQSTDAGAPVQASMGGRLDADLFRMAATGDAAATTLGRLLERVREEPLPATELAELRGLSADAYTSLELRGRPYFSLASEVAIHALHDRLDVIARHAPAVEAATGETVRQAARRWLAPEARIAVRFEGTGEAQQQLPADARELLQLAIDASESGQLELAIQAYTRLLELGPNRMNTVIYLTSRGQIRMEQKEYSVAIRDFEEALAVVDYPAVRDLLEEARTLERGALRRSPDDAAGSDPASRESPATPSSAAGTGP